MSSDDKTDETATLPWSSGEHTGEPRAPHLTVIWFLNEPERVGQTARIDGRCWFGRGAMAEDAIRFREIRPGSVLGAPVIERTSISRRQLTFEPGGPGEVVVRSVGQRKMLHNGVESAECAARAGDTLMLENAALFLVEERTSGLRWTSEVPREHGFRFGQADEDGMVGESEAAWRLREALRGMAEEREHVLVAGESGAGKELAARALHRLSGRSGALVARSAATLPPTLFDAELFGSARNYPHAGAPEREGLVGAADGGTLFLDEIAELGEREQGHLLRVLDTGGEYHRLGEARERQSDFRLVAATNRPPEELKHDVLARFTLRLFVPGLGDRRADVPLIARELLARITDHSSELRARFFDETGPKVDPMLVDVLVRHPYTHHTRELLRLLRVVLASSPGNYLAPTPELFRELGDPGESGATGPGEPPGALRHSPTRDEIAVVLRDLDGNVSQAAERLGLSRDQLRRLIAKHGLQAGR